MTEFFATRVRYNPDERGGQWISYLNWEVEDGEYPLIDDSAVVFTDTGAFDAVVDDVDTSEEGQSGYYITFTAGPLLESY